MPRLRLYLVLPALLLLINGCAPVDNRPSPDDPKFPATRKVLSTRGGPDGLAGATCPTPESDGSLTAEEVEQLRRLPDWLDSQSSTEEEDTALFPVTVNPQVSYYLDFFRNKHSKSFGRWLSRSGRYLPMIREEMEKAGLPAELAYLPMIESGFSTDARSPAGAAGLWQFMERTGRQYGLVINSYVDQRYDPMASTQAAILYLRDLYREFGTWPLAVAGYNAGNGTVRNALQKTEGDTFWDIAKSCYLREETKLYVPKLMATILIARTPEEFGFDQVEPEPAVTFETVEVPPLTRLEAIAVAGGLSEETLQDLNRELRQALTPPDLDYAVRVPSGHGRRILANLERVKPVIATEYKTHVVGPGDTVASICRDHNLNTLTLLKANNLRRPKLSEGQRLRIPVQNVHYVLLEDGKSGRDLDKDYLVLHTVKPGETLSAIAMQYDVTTQLLAAWNDIKDARKVRAGSQLALYFAHGSRPELATARGGAAPTRSSGGRDTGGEERITYYQVRQGDSLWKIGRRFNLPADSIRRWNGMEGNTLQPGTRLKLKLAGDIDA
ncbi:MAG: LysM peptidoglycan-binding domain-containing protein [Thermodesulfobacteriota bacterium]